MLKEYKMRWEEFDERCRYIAKTMKKSRKIKNIFGVPRGGLVPAVRLSYLTGLPLTENPQTDSTMIVDDILDSGATIKSFNNFYFHSVVINKKEEGITDWIVMPWEEK